MPKRVCAESGGRHGLRWVYAALSVAVLWVVFTGLNADEARRVYGGYEKWLHAAVFYGAWWLARLSLPLRARWVTLVVLVVAVGVGAGVVALVAVSFGRFQVFL